MWRIGGDKGRIVEERGVKEADINPVARQIVDFIETPLDYIQCLSNLFDFFGDSAL